MPISWTQDLSVNIVRIDTEHKQLVAMLGELEEAIGLGKGEEQLQEIVSKMSDYAKVHFQTEEKLMAKHSFPGLDDHVSEHEDFAVKVMDLVFEPDSEHSSPESVLAFLKDWLVNHISGTDKLYGPFLNERGVF